MLRLSDGDRDSTGMRECIRACVRACVRASEQASEQGCVYAALRAKWLCVSARAKCFCVNTRLWNQRRNERERKIGTARDRGRGGRERHRNTENERVKREQ